MLSVFDSTVLDGERNSTVPKFPRNVLFSAFQTCIMQIIRLGQVFNPLGYVFPFIQLILWLFEHKFYFAVDFPVIGLQIGVIYIHWRWQCLMYNWPFKPHLPVLPIGKDDKLPLS